MPPSRSRQGTSLWMIASSTRSDQILMPCNTACGQCDALQGEAPVKAHRVGPHAQGIPFPAASSQRGHGVQGRDTNDPEEVAAEPGAILSAKTYLLRAGTAGSSVTEPATRRETIQC